MSPKSPFRILHEEPIMTNPFESQESAKAEKSNNRKLMAATILGHIYNKHGFALCQEGQERQGSDYEKVAGLYVRTAIKLADMIDKAIS
jgi:hypothetical protein